MVTWLHCFYFNRQQLRYSAQKQTAMQEMSLQEMPRHRDGSQMGDVQRREAGSVQTLFQEKR
jgi:hypothetical protein